MSKSYFNKFINYTKLALDSKINPIYIYSVNIVLAYCHGCFAVGTKKQEELLITKKYKFVSNGFTNFMVIDDKGRHFNVNNSFWYWKWDAIEDWSNINVINNNKIRVSYYGYRIPILGMFPNIVCSNEPIFDDKSKVDLLVSIKPF
jgi:hypothetical protein